MAAKTRFDIEGWVKERAASKMTACNICSVPEAKAAVLAVLPYLLRGAPGVSYESIAETLLPKFNIRLSGNSVRRHIKNHEQEALQALIHNR